MKTAKNMKVLYHYTEGIINNKSCVINDNSMEFDQSPSRGQNQANDKKLKPVDILIDLKISIEKIDKNILLSEDGNLYHIE
jgi:hypothetical protein